jgi:CHAT domain-containing protein
MELLRAIRDELRELTARTSALAAEASFRRIVEGRETMGALVPSDPQLRAAAENHERFRRWRMAVSAVLRRRGVVPAARFHPAADEFAQVVLLRHVDDPDITAGRWRAEFVSQVEALARELSDVIDASPDAFRTIPRQSIAYHCFDVPIDAGAARLETFGCDVQVGDKRDVSTLRSLANNGQALFRTFVDQAAYRSALDGAARAGTGLRVQLDVTRAGPLSSKPWESLHDGDGFIALRSSTPLTRRIDSKRKPATLPSIAPPLRILLTLSSPKSVAWFDAEQGRRLVESAIAPLALLGLAELDVCPDGRAITLRHLLRAAAAAGRPYHIWHFLGHGRYDERVARGELVMTADDGQPHYVGGTELDLLFAEQSALRLVILSSCDSVRGRDDPGSAVAAACVAAGIAAVVAMQTDITKRAAMAFIDELYNGLAEGLTVAAAVAEARHAVFLQPNYVEWMIPVAFIAGEDAPLVSLPS